MGNIINDIVEDIDIKPNKTKIVFKWLLIIGTTLIGLAFAFGQFKSSFFNRMDVFETSIIENTVAIKQLKETTVVGFEKVNARVDKGYDDGMTILGQYQQNNIQQMGLIIDYGTSNKDMLKRMLTIGAMNLDGEVNKIKNENPMGEEYIGVAYFINIDTNDTTFSVTGATQKYIDGLDTNHYDLALISASKKYPNRFDFSYSNK